MQKGFALAPFFFWVIQLFLKGTNTRCIFSFFFSSIEYDKDSKLLLRHEPQAIAVTNSITYWEPSIDWVSVKRSLRCVNNIDFQNKTGERKENKSCFFFLQRLANDNWHFYSTKTSLRAGSQ